MSLPLISLSDSVFDSYNELFPLKIYLIIWSTGFPITYLLNFFNPPFFLLSLPFVAIFVFPLFHSLYLIFIKFKTSSTIIQKILGIILIFAIVHGFNFAIFRMDEGAQLWGWSVSFFLAHALFMTLPYFTIEKQLNTEKKRLENLVDIRTKENSNLLRIILHDLITPLNTQWSYIEAWKNGTIKKEIATPKIERSTKIIKEIIQEVREIESLKIEKKEINLTKLNPLDCINEALSNLEDQIMGKNLTVKVENNANNSYLLGHKNLLINIILDNILKNSIKFSFENNAMHISIYTDKDYILFDIKDEGIGIPKNMLKDLFTYSIKTSRLGTNGEKGNGLGLHILKDAIKMLKGDIQFKSIAMEDDRNNHGTTSTLSILKFKS